jgi:hypothetical protein
MPFALLCAAVFTVAACNDAVWSKYILAVGQKRATHAGLWAAGTLLLGAFGIVSYTTDHWLAIPAAAGCFVGSYTAVKRS